MHAWIRIGQPLEPVISDYKCIFDAWEDGGACGFVFGRTLFSDLQGHHYSRLRFEPTNLSQPWTSTQ